MCCRNVYTGNQSRLGEWYYPDGRMVNNQNSSRVNGEGFYRMRGRQTVSILHILNSTIPTGSYCCQIPTTEESVTFCANIGSDSILGINLAFKNNYSIQFCVHPSLL